MDIALITNAQTGKVWRVPVERWPRVPFMIGDRICPLDGRNEVLTVVALTIEGKAVTRTDGVEEIWSFDDANNIGHVYGGDPNNPEE